MNLHSKAIDQAPQSYRKSCKVVVNVELSSSLHLSQNPSRSTSATAPNAAINHRQRLEYPQSSQPFELDACSENTIGTYTRLTLSEMTLDCLYCKCGSRLMHRCKGEGTVNVKGGCLDGLNMKEAVHIWRKEAIVDIPPWAEGYDGEPPPDSL